MLQTLKQLYGNKLNASNGEISHVSNLCFDDKSRMVRYAFLYLLFLGSLGVFLLCADCLRWLISHFSFPTALPAGLGKRIG